MWSKERILGGAAAGRPALLGHMLTDNSLASGTRVGTPQGAWQWEVKTNIGHKGIFLKF